MSDVRTILYNLSAGQGWDGATMLELCLNYIEAQESNEAFEDFLAQHAKIESDFRGPVREEEVGWSYDGWNDPQGRDGAATATVILVKPNLKIFPHPLTNPQNCGIIKLTLRKEAVKNVSNK